MSCLLFADWQILSHSALNLDPPLPSDIASVVDFLQITAGQFTVMVGVLLFWHVVLRMDKAFQALFWLLHLFSKREQNQEEKKMREQAWLSVWREMAKHAGMMEMMVMSVLMPMIVVSVGLIHSREKSFTPSLGLACETRR